MKLGACIVFLVLLIGMVYLASAKTFLQGTLYCYTIWIVVNAFETLVLDLGLMVHWKKCIGRSITKLSPRLMSVVDKKINVSLGMRRVPYRRKERQ